MRRVPLFVKPRKSLAAANPGAVSRRPAPAMRGVALASMAILGFAGCASVRDSAKEALPVSVSAANYSQLSDAELYDHVYGSPNARPEPPQAPKPAQPLFYLLLPGEVYPSDVAVGTVYRELEYALETRGYFNAIYHEKAGRMPARIDYLLRVHYGKRPWLTPIVRPDRVTWGNDGLVSNRYKSGLMSEWSFDPRVGLSSEEVLRTLGAFANHSTITVGGIGGGFGMGPGQGLNAFSESAWSSFGSNRQLWRDFGEDGQEARDFYLLVVEAFRTDEVRAMGSRAPCTWITFVAVPADAEQRFSDVLRSMLRTAAPYFGGSTLGPQEYEVPTGKVLMGAPVEVPGPQKRLEP